MAESYIDYNDWSKEFEVGEFAVFWLIIETVLDEEKMKQGPPSLDWRLQQLICKDCLGEDWYHVTCLDDVIGDDESRFREILASAVNFVRFSSSEKKSFWSMIKRSEQAYKVGRFRYGDLASIDALIGLVVRFSLPWLSPDVENPLMTALGWVRISKGRSV
jgi:hypothetical protein